MKQSFTNFFSKWFKKSETKATCCNGCMDVLHMVIDGEATEDQIKYLNEHIDECAPCYNHYKIDKSVKEVIKHKLGNKTVPPALLDNIKSKLGQQVK